jgi:hypothetical protein
MSRYDFGVISSAQPCHDRAIAGPRASFILATLIVACIVLLPQRAGKHPETT